MVTFCLLVACAAIEPEHPVFYAGNDELRAYLRYCGIPPTPPRTDE